MLWWPPWKRTALRRSLALPAPGAGNCCRESRLDWMHRAAVSEQELLKTFDTVYRRTEQISSLAEARDVLRRYADHYNTQTIK